MPRKSSRFAGSGWETEPVLKYCCEREKLPSAS
jgi:hypothetical protein